MDVDVDGGGGRRGLLTTYEVGVGVGYGLV